ncbi:hypothetical protein KFL_000560200 [Klebsormidium nitens]|uniref:F-box domain-containing protein n=1 Tax=Klebsormidium nitens TaxID=105231 RepID=A0A1Y1HPH4_KLENI|nr:hypothetical protein KFL_000560200 [Klebsormidium nitens]|eukprot:GAQ80530.1 hypothetical protein KFL_000560200 [Klebsormidium nitens]
METSSGCDALPDQQWVSIFSSLGAKDLLRASFVSRRFKSIALQVPNVNNTARFYTKVPPQSSDHQSSSSARREPQSSVELKGLMKRLPGLLKNALVLRMDESAGNKCAGCLEAMEEVGELPTSLGALEWRGVRVADLPGIAQLLQKDLREIQLKFVRKRSSVSVLGAFIAAVANTCPALETLRLRLHPDSPPGLVKLPSDCDSDDDVCEPSDTSDCDSDYTEFEGLDCEDPNSGLFVIDEVSADLEPSSAILGPLQVQNVLSGGGGNADGAPQGGGYEGLALDENDGESLAGGSGTQERVAPTENFCGSVRRLLRNRRVVRELPYAMLAHFEGAWRHEGLQSLTLHGLADAAHCTDTINAITCHFPALRHLALSSCASGGHVDARVVQSRVCLSKTLETVQMYGFIYPRSCAFDMPRLRRLVLTRAHRLSVLPLDNEGELDTPALMVGVLDSNEEEGQGVAWKRSQASYLQLHCPALKELHLGFPISGAALSEAGTRLLALRTLELRALSEPDFVLSGGFPALVSARLGFQFSAAQFFNIEHPTVRAVTAYYGALKEPLDGRKHLAISCAALEDINVRGVQRFGSRRQADVPFVSAIWAPRLRHVDLTGTAGLTSALGAAADIEKLMISIKAGEDLEPLSALKKLRELQVLCDKGCDALVLESASLAELDVIIMSAELARVHVSTPRLVRLKIKNVVNAPLHVAQLRLALGHVSKLRLPFGVTSLQFGAECPRLQKLQLPAYLGTAVHVDRATFPALKSLQLVLPKTRLRSVNVRSETLQRFKVHAVRPLATPEVCTIQCPQLRELHLHVVPPSLRALGAGCPSLETLVVAGGLHMDPPAQIDPDVKRKAPLAAGTLQSLRIFFVPCGTRLGLPKQYPDQGSSGGETGGGLRIVNEFYPASTKSTKGKEKVDEGGGGEGGSGGGGRERGSEGKEETAEQSVVEEYCIELGEEYPSLREAHIQVWTGAQPSKEFQRRFGLSAGRDWCNASSAFEEEPRMRGSWDSGAGDLALRYAAADFEETEGKEASLIASPEAANPTPVDGPETQRTSAPCTKASETATRASEVGSSNRSVGKGSSFADEEPFLSRLTSKIPSHGEFPRGLSSRFTSPSLKVKEDNVRLTSLCPVLNLDVTCPKLRELQVFSDLRVESATVVSTEMRCLRGWVVAEGAEGMSEGVRLLCPKMEKMDWQIA